MGGPGEQDSLAQQSVGDYLVRLASRTSMPAGGVVCALQAAQAAALVAMAAKFSSTAESDRVAELARDADRIIANALGLAEEDQRAYAEVSAALSLPRDDPDRPAHLARALVGASRPPAGVVSLVGQVVTLAERLLPVLNPMLKADLAVAVDVAHAAASGARTTIEANLDGVTVDGQRDAVLVSLDDVDQILARTTAVRESVRRRKNAGDPAHTP